MGDSTSPRSPGLTRGGGAVSLIVFKKSIALPAHPPPFPIHLFRKGTKLPSTNKRLATSSLTHPQSWGTYSGSDKRQSICPPFVYNESCWKQAATFLPSHVMVRQELEADTPPFKVQSSLKCPATPVELSAGPVTQWGPLLVETRSATARTGRGLPSCPPHSKARF